MKFRITRHSSFRPPNDAIDILWERLGTRRDEIWFSRVGAEIRATWGEEMRDSLARERGAEVGRQEIVELLRDICDRDPALRSDWYAVSPLA